MTTLTATTRPTSTHHERFDTPRSRVQGAAMIAAPALLLASTVASVAGEGLAADRAGGAIQVYAFALLFLVVAAITRILDAPLPRAAAGLSVVGVVGVTAGIGFGFGRIVADLAGFDLSESTSAVVPIAMLLPGLLWPLTLIGSGLGLLKAGMAPRWSGALLAATGLLFPISRIGEVEVLSIAADIVFLVALIPLGLAMLAGRDPLAPRPS